MSAKICIVTPDIVGPVKNGGVGTACYHLAREMERGGMDVTVLFAGEAEEQWIQWYQEMGIAFEILSALPIRLTDDSEIYRESYTVLQYLKEKSFDFIHFMDFKGLGFHTIQAKRTMGLFAESVLTVTVHSPHTWIFEGMRQWLPDPVYFSKIGYMERYSIANADIVICPSQYILDWMREKGWAVPADTRVIPNCFSDEVTLESHLPDPSHLVFFGRLEKRKGLDIFCGEVDFSKVRHVTFLGKIESVDGVPADVYIQERLPVPYTIFDAFDKNEALDYIRKTRGLVVMPSLSDNLPYSVVECVMNGIPFVTTHVGGIPEIADGQCCLFPRMDVDWESVRHPYNPQAARRRWLDLHKAEPRKISITGTPLISVIVPFYNDYTYIDPCLASLKANDYPNFEIIVCDDGSDVPLERADVTVVRKPNGGPAGARNFAAKHAKGEYLVFCDSDNVFDPDFVSSLVKGILLSDADGLTVPNKRSDETIWFPLGGCAELGVLDNIFGDMACIVKKSVFDALGGLDEALKEYEDWAFFSKLTLAGYTLDVIPEPLYWYRIKPDGINGAASRYRGHNEVAKLYGIHPLLLPYFYINESANAQWRFAIAEAERVHEAAVDEARRAHENAVDELRRAHEAAKELLERTHKTAEEILRNAAAGMKPPLSEGLKGWLKRRLWK